MKKLLSLFTVIATLFCVSCTNTDGESDLAAQFNDYAGIWAVVESVDDDGVSESYYDNVKYLYCIEGNEMSEKVTSSKGIRITNGCISATLDNFEFSTRYLLTASEGQCCVQMDGATWTMTLNGSKLLLTSNTGWRIYLEKVEETSPIQIQLSSEPIILGREKNSSAQVQVYANCDWVATSSATWLTINTRMGNGNAIITLTARTENYEQESRTATLTIIDKTGKYSATVEVIQMGAETIVR